MDSIIKGILAQAVSKQIGVLLTHFEKKCVLYSVMCHVLISNCWCKWVLSTCLTYSLNCMGINVKYCGRLQITFCECLHLVYALVEYLHPSTLHIVLYYTQLYQYRTHLVKWLQYNNPLYGYIYFYSQTLVNHKYDHGVLINI